MLVYDALYDGGVEHLLCRHEQGAAMAALGYARATGKVGVCIATSGPGATNLITGVGGCAAGFCAGCGDYWSGGFTADRY